MSQNRKADVGNDAEVTKTRKKCQEKCSSYFILVTGTHRHRRNHPLVERLVGLLFLLSLLFQNGSALAACKFKDGSVENADSCTCKVGHDCKATEYCLSGVPDDVEPCTFFPLCRSRRTSLISPNGVNSGSFGTAANFADCLRCDPLREYDCIECRVGSSLYLGVCHRTPQFYSNAGDLGWIVGLLSDGGIEQWGHHSASNHGNFPPDDIPAYVWPAINAGGGVRTISPGEDGFSAILMDGGVVAWGTASRGADIPPETIAAVKASGGARAIATTGQCWAVLLEDGGAAAWGTDPNCGSKVPTAEITKMKAKGGGLEIYATTTIQKQGDRLRGAFLVVTRNRTLACWGYEFLAQCGLLDEDIITAGGVRAVFAGKYSFFVHLFDSTMFVWPSGNAVPLRSNVGARRGVGGEESPTGGIGGYFVYNDGTLSGLSPEYFLSNEHALVAAGGGVQELIAVNGPNTDIYVALLRDGSVVQRKHNENENKIITSTVQANIAAGGGATVLYTTGNAYDAFFAVILKNGKILCWGGDYTVGFSQDTTRTNPASRNICRAENGDIPSIEKQMVEEAGGAEYIVHSGMGFAALLKNKKVIAWGAGENSFPHPVTAAATNAIEQGGGAVSLASLCQGVYLCGGRLAYIVTCVDGSVVTWGSGPNYVNFGFSPVPTAIAARMKMKVRRMEPESVSSCPLGFTDLLDDELGCIPCPFGTVSPPLIDYTDRKCQACPTGKRVLALSAAAYCVACDPGMYDATPDILDDACVVCPSGQFDGEPQSAKINCTQCPKNTYIGDDGNDAQKHDQFGDCESCPVNQMTSGGSGQTKEIGAEFCGVCGAGRFTKNGAAVERACLQCPLGYFQDSSANVSCMICRPGFYQGEEGRAFCLPW